jgi:hypothetical protein
VSSLKEGGKIAPFLKRKDQLLRTEPRQANGLQKPISLASSHGIFFKDFDPTPTERSEIGIRLVLPNPSLTHRRRSQRNPTFVEAPHYY